jgi:hypothetical protein
MTTDTEPTEEASEIQIRTWPAIVLALVNVVSLMYALLLGDTLVQFLVGGILIPLLVLIALTIWWMLCRKIPFKQRLAMVGIGFLSLAWIVISHPLMTGGFPFLIIVLPIINIGSVALLVVSTGNPWPQRRKALTLYLVAMAIFLTAVRVDGSRGDETPILAWQWSPTPEEVAIAELEANAVPNEVAAISDETGEGDWLSFRGPDCDSRVPGVTFATNWNEEPPTELWRQSIGLGWSSFTVVGEYFFTQEQRGEDELVVCYEANTGKQVWTNGLTARFDETHGSGPRATPTFHEGNLYVQGATGALQCIDASTGETIWKRELTEDAEAEVPTWGFSSSPLIIDGLVVAFAGGENGKSVLAYEIGTGEPVWEAGAGTHSYSTVQLATIDDVPQLLVPSNFGIQSFEPATGSLLWEEKIPGFADSARCVQPVMLPPNDFLFTDELGARRFEIIHTDGAWLLKERWTNKKFKPSFNDTVVHEGFAYGFTGRAFVCIDTQTGERRWKGGRYGGQVLLMPDMKTLLATTDKGEVILIEATPDAHNEIARFKALDAKTWNHPVIANGKLFLRNSEEVVCYELPGWKASVATPS